MTSRALGGRPRRRWAWHPLEGGPDPVPSRRVSEGQLVCTTPPGAAPASVPIRLQVGGAQVPGSWAFNYREDPVVLGISPNCGYT